VDELALDLHDGALLVPQFLAHGWLSESAAKAIGALDQYLGTLSGDEYKYLWTAAALQDTDQWETVRRLAREALAVI
jgi:hypothetical protein